MADVHQQLRERRERSSLSLRDLAGRVGVAYSTLSQYETGRIDIPLSMLVAWAQALGLRIDILLRPKDQADLDVTSGERRALLRSVTENVHMLTDRECRIIRGQIETIVKLSAEDAGHKP